MNGGRNIQLIVQFNSKLLEGFELFQKKKKKDLEVICIILLALIKFYIIYQYEDWLLPSLYVIFISLFET